MSESHDQLSKRGKRTIVRRIIFVTLSFALALAVAGYVALQVSPWPSALIVRAEFDALATKRSEGLRKHVPSRIAAQLDQHYEIGDNDAYLDVYYPSEIENTERSLPTVVWVHGGGWISGNKNHVANYCKILASKGYTVVAVDYSLAPHATYPTPIRQVNSAVSYLRRNAKRLHVDASHIVLAGDSGGAQIVAQLANIISVPSYANVMGVVPAMSRTELTGLILYCGAYDVQWVHVDGYLGIFRETLVWSYLGIKEYLHDPRFAPLSVMNYITSEFPPTFISAGNDDPLERQSHTLVTALAAQGVYVDSLFFASDFAPAQPHEYQFNLDGEAGRLALDRSVRFLDAR